MTIRDFIDNLSNGNFNEKLRELYGSSEMDILKQRLRLTDVCERFAKLYPTCDNIKIMSVPACIKFGDIPFFISADKIVVSGIDSDFRYISDNISKEFESADINMAEKDYAYDCLSGYSICFAKSNSRIRKNSSDSYVRLYTAICDDEKERCILECDALSSNDTAEFFQLVNGSSMYTLCDYTTRLGVLTGRNFLGGDGAVTAENNIVKALIPTYTADEYLNKMSDIFGSENCILMKIRNIGITEVTV